MEIEKALRLHVSSSGDDWQSVEYQAEEDEGEHGWRQVRVSFELEDKWNWHWFRLTLTDAYPKEEVQIGQVVISGYLDQRLTDKYSARSRSSPIEGGFFCV